MKRTSTLLLAFICAGVFIANAGTPTIDGVFNPTEGWGTSVATGDGIEGWAGANAKSLYTTSDANYIYFGAEVNAADWQQFIIAVNTKAGGGTTDPWGRKITYAHTNAPDFLLRGDIAKDNYAQYQVWNGTDWTGTNVNVNEGKQEVKSTFNGNAGFLELRVPKATLGNGDIDAQFVIGGDNDTHGCFDAIPNDNNATDWGAPGNATILSKYVGGVILPVKFTSFSGSLKGSTVSLVWELADDLNTKAYDVEQSAGGNGWQTAGRVVAAGVIGKGSYNYQVANLPSAFNYYRIKVINKDGTVLYSKTISFKINAKPGLALVTNPVTSGNLKLTVNMAEQAVLQASLTAINGKVVSNTQYRHTGGSSILQIEIAGLQKGVYVLKVTSDTMAQSFKVVIQ